MRLLRLFELPTGAVGGAAIPALLRPHRVQVISICRAPVLTFVANSFHRYKVSIPVFGNLSGTIKDFRDLLGWEISGGAVYGRGSII